MNAVAVTTLTFSLTLATMGSLIASPTAAGHDDSVCGSTASVILKAARHDANEEFWITIAGCLNDRDADIEECVREALDERRDAFHLAKLQFRGRLQICEELGDGPYDPDIHPCDFSTNINNTYLPLVPGRTMIYEADTDEGLERIEVATLDETIDVDGFECVIVKDIVWLEDEVIEDTDDWFAQHANGDVWYFGEISRNFEDGLLHDLDGSWRTGEDHAKPGVVMLGCPRTGTLYREEFLPNEAEDMGRVISLDETVTVPYGTFQHCIQIEATTPIEPDALEWKYYAPGVGLVLEVKPKTGERLELIDIKN